MKQEGDILVFVPAISHIIKSCQEINQTIQKSLVENVICLTLYSGIPKDQEDLIKDKDKYKELPGKPKRKIIFSTNVAESGVTIDGIKIVIESGLAMNVTYDSTLRMRVMRKEYISQFEIIQRKGRAGRTSPGICYHLYTEEQFKGFKISKPSEILTISLDYLVMDLLKIATINKLRDVNDFMLELIEPPSSTQINSTINYLKELNVIKGDALTEFGLCLHHLNVDVGIGLAIMVSDYFDVIRSVIRIASMLSVDSNISKWFRRPADHERRSFMRMKQGYLSVYSDLQMFLKLYEEFKGVRDRRSWARKRFLYLHKFYEAEKNERQLSYKYKNIPESCRIKSKVSKAKDRHKNIILAFMHGYFNQKLRNTHEDKYKNRDGISMSIRAGRYNQLSTLKKTIIYMELSDILGNVQANGLINVTDEDILGEIKSSMF